MADDGKRSLFSAGRSGSKRSADGREALYSAADEPGGPVKIDCARCGVTTEVGVLDALGRLVRFSVWIPGRTYSRRLTCPACGRRSWVRLRLL